MRRMTFRNVPGAAFFLFFVICSPLFRAFFFELGIVDFPVNRAGLHKFLMGPKSLYPAVIQDDDLIREPY